MNWHDYSTNDPAYDLRQRENFRDDASGNPRTNTRCGRCAANLKRNAEGYLICPNEPHERKK